MFKSCIFFLIKTFFIFFIVVNASAYNDDITHPDMTDKAVEASQLDSYVKNNLGFKEGIYKLFTANYKKNNIKDWIKAGSTKEDSPPCRASNHFHNPILPWDQSYMSDDVTPLALIIREFCNNTGWHYLMRKSNVTWATGYLSPAPEGAKDPFSFTLPFNEPINWDKAREYYYKALTDNSNTNREFYFAKTFKASGHVIHLLQDLSVPAHTRNDFQSHLIIDSVNGLIQPYEYYVKIYPGLVNIADPDNNFPAFSNISVTNFFDTDQYDGSNPSTSLTIGLSEYSNANFLTDTTIFKDILDPLHLFPYPNWLSVEEYNEIIDPIKGKVRTYLRKIGDGEIIEHLVAGKWFYKYLPSSIKNLGLELDDKCHYDYAQKLLPRAVGYSAGLLDYFFRGTLEISAPDSYVYSIIDGSVAPQEFSYIKARVRNTTPLEVDANGDPITYEPIQDGIIQAVAKYKIVPNYLSDLSNYPPDGNVMQNIEYSYSVSEPITLSPEEVALLNTQPKEFTFNFINPIPAGITDLYLQVVFKGTLGNEPDIAIAVGMKDIREPTHHVFWNATDKFLLNGTLYTSAEIKNTGKLRKEVDLDHDKVFNEINEGEPYIDPHYMTLKIGYMDASPPATPPIDTATVYLPPGRHIRVIVLVEDSQADPWLRFHHIDNIDTNSYGDYPFPGVINQEDANGVWQVPTEASTLRGVIQHFYVLGVRCKPIEVDPNGVQYCPYPLDAPPPDDPTPYPVNIAFP